MTAPGQHPLVSIGVFVHNEAPYLRETLDSLLQQDYANFEILIADNCSSDDSGSICEEFAARDHRIRYVRHEQNIGAPANSIYVLDEARGDYFMWASGHDLWSPNFVSGCVAALESSPDAAIAAASCTWIDADGNVIEKESGCYDTRGLGSLRRFFFAFWGNLHPVLGLIRMEHLRNVPKIHECVGADQILLTDLALRGDFLHVPEASWCRRQPRQEESHRDKIKRYTGSEFQFGGNWIDRRMPLVRLPIEQLKIVVRSRLRLLDKIVLITAILPAFALRYLDGRRS